MNGMQKHEALLLTTMVVGVWIPCSLYMMRSPAWRRRRRFWLTVHTAFATPLLWLLCVNQTGSKMVTGPWMRIGSWNPWALLMVVLFVWGAIAAILGLRSCWREARTEKDRFPGELPIGSVKGRLLWLILPVLFLVVFGVSTLVRDRSQYRQSAYQVAAGLAEKMAGELSQSLPLELFQFDSWMESFDGPPELRSRMEKYLIPYQLSDATPDSGLLPLVGRVDARGRVFGMGESLVNDESASWLTLNPTPELTQALSAVFSSTNGAAADAAIERLERLHADAPPAQSDYAYFRLDLDLLRKYNRIRWSEDNEMVMRSLLLEIAYSGRASRLQGAAGVRLVDLSFREYRRRFPDAPLADWIVGMIQDLTYRDGFAMTPWMMEQGVSMARNSGVANKQAAMRRIQQLWNQQERFRELAHELRSQQTFDPSTIASRWFSKGDRQYFAIIKPSWAVTTSYFPGKGEKTETSRFSEVRIYDEAAVGIAAKLALRQSSYVDGGFVSLLPPLPAGWRVAIWLEDRRLKLAGNTAENQSFVDDAHATNVLGAVTQACRPRSSLDSTGVHQDSDLWPSRPNIRVEILRAESGEVADIDQQNASVFGFLILTTAGIAGLGAWQTHRAFQQQIQLNESRSNFVSSVSHEMRAPLASMRLFADGLARSETLDESKRQMYAKFLVQEINRLGNLVENVLDFSRINLGRRRFQFALVEFDRLVHETTSQWVPQAREKQLTLRCCMAGQDVALQEPLVRDAFKWDMVCDADAMKQVLVNLLDNAIKQSPAGGAIQVNLDRGPGLPALLILSVEDEGPGVPRNVRQQIFEPFYRHESELTRETQGVGLGLSIVRQLVEAQKGLVYVEDRLDVSRKPIPGARFVVELPVNPHPAIPE